MHDSGDTTIDSKTGKTTENWNDWSPIWTIKRQKSLRVHRKSNDKTSGHSGQKTPKKPKTTHDFQEGHSPTESHKLRLTQERTTAQCQRRILDARLWSNLSPHQQDAALQIEHAYKLMSVGLGYRTSAPHLERIGGTRKNDLDDYQADKIKFYFDWATACTKDRLIHAAAIDILIFGKSCAATDAARKVRKGWAKMNLVECLTLYCKMKGWPID